MSRLAFCALTALALSACSGDDDGGVSPALEADIERLRVLMIDDPAQTPLEEVERVAVERPIEAARLLETGGIPAARRQLRAAEALRVRSDEGRAFRRRLVAAYQERVTALVEYEDVLEGASLEEERLLEVLRAQSAVELALMRVDGDMERLAPTAAPREPEDERAEDEGSEDEGSEDEGGEDEGGEDGPAEDDGIAPSGLGDPRGRR